MPVLLSVRETLEYKYMLQVLYTRQHYHQLAEKNNLYSTANCFIIKLIIKLIIVCLIICL